MDYAPLFMPAISFNHEENREAPLRKRLSNWMDAAIVWAGCPGPIGQRIAQQLHARPRPPESVWGNDPERIRIARLVCHLATENLSWPNEHFVPEDPARVAFFEHVDGLDFTAMVIELEKELGTRFCDEEVLSWFGMTLGEVVAWLQNRVSIQHSA